MEFIIYHQVKTGVDCPDGIAAAWVAKQKYPEAELIGCVYGESVSFSHRPERIIIVDFSFPKSTLEKWSEFAEVIVIDHHVTAMQNLEGLTDKVLCKFDETECGATLTWKTFFPDKEMPAFLEYVKDRDLWDFLLPYTHDIHEAVAHLKKNMRTVFGTNLQNRLFSLFGGLAKLDRDELISFLAPIGRPLLEPKRKQVSEIASRYELQRLPILDNNLVYPDAVPTVKLAKDGSEDRLTSDVCMKLYRDMPQYPFVACITSDGKWSLRSDKHGSNYDVSAIAKLYSGGGHRNSSGFSPKE